MGKEILIIAGANGVGKTTFAKAFLRESKFEFLNADEIAKELLDRNPVASNLSAGKEFFRRLNELTASGNSFLIESTLSGNYLKRVLAEQRDKG